MRQYRPSERGEISAHVRRMTGPPMRLATHAPPIATVLGALVLLLAAPDAAAQQCPRLPPGFRPHLDASTDATLVSKPMIDVAVDVNRDNCDHVTPLRAPDTVRFVVAEGPSAGTTLEARRARHGSLRVTLPGVGRFVLRAESVREPDLTPATLAVRVIDPSRAHRVTVRLHRSPRDAHTRLRRSARIDDGDGHHTGWVRLHGRGDVWQTAPIFLEPGSYHVSWPYPDTDPYPRAARSADGHGCRQRGRRLSGLAHDGARRLAPVRRADVPDHARRARQDGDGEAHGSGDADREDIAPGPAVLHLSSTPRTDPWDPDSPAHHWTERFRDPVVVPEASAISMRWSMPRLLAGEPPTRVPSSGCRAWARRSRPFTLGSARTTTSPSRYGAASQVSWDAVWACSPTVAGRAYPFPRCSSAA